MATLGLEKRSLPLMSYSEQDELLKAIKIRLRVHNLVPKRDATFWAEEILLYLKFLNDRGSKNGGFEWYDEAHRQKKRNEKLWIAIFFMIIFIISLYGDF